jgi:hypothetical protein
VTGDSTLIGAVVRVSPADFDVTPGVVPVTPTSTHRYVRYYLGGVGAIAPDGVSTGLIREEFIRVPAEIPDVDPTPFRAFEVVSDKVVGFSVSYYDGSEWYSEWPLESSSAPLAVDLQLTVQVDPAEAPGAKRGASKLELVRVFVDLRRSSSASALDEG